MQVSDIFTIVGVGLAIVGLGMNLLTELIPPRIKPWIAYPLIVFGLVMAIFPLFYQTKIIEQQLNPNPVTVIERKTLSKKETTTNPIQDEINKTVILGINKRIQDAYPIMVRFYSSQTDEEINKIDLDKEAWFRETIIFLSVNLGDKYTKRLEDIKNEDFKMNGVHPRSSNAIYLTMKRMMELEKIKKEIINLYTSGQKIACMGQQPA